MKEPEKYGRLRPKKPSQPSNAAFINAIAEEGTKAEAVAWLQKIWGELCEARAEIERLQGGTVPVYKAREA